MATVRAIANQKGGVGKTSLTISLAAALALTGRRVLLVDTDQQGNLTTLSGVRAEDLDYALFDTMVPTGAAAVSDALTHNVHGVPGLDLLPGDLRLATLDLVLAAADFREQRLATVLEPILANYDDVLIDCPPNLGLMTKNALCAADLVVVPIKMEDRYAVEGGTRMLDTIAELRNNRFITLRVEFETVVRTVVDGRSEVGKQLDAYLAASGLPVARTELHDRKVWVKAGRDGVPATFWRGSRSLEVRQAVVALARELWPDVTFPEGSEVFRKLERLHANHEGDPVAA